MSLDEFHREKRANQSTIHACNDVMKMTPPRIKAV